MAPVSYTHLKEAGGKGEIYITTKKTKAVEKTIAKGNMKVEGKVVDEQLSLIHILPFNKKYSMPLVRLAMVLAPLRVVA